MKHINAITAAMLSCIISTNAFADDEQGCTHRWWINLGIGAGYSDSSSSPGDKFGPAVQLSFNGMLTEKLFLTIENTATSGNHLGDGYYDTGILLGYKSKKPTWYWSAAAGISHLVVEEKYYPVWGYRKKDGVALPIDLQLFYTPFKHFGFGLIGHGVIGGHHNFATIMLGLQIS